MNIGDEKTAERQGHKAKSAVVTVVDGRDFVVQYEHDRLSLSQPNLQRHEAQ
jgi:hypothetical protein